jgi:hypothetical protein
MVGPFAASWEARLTDELEVRLDAQDSQMPAAGEFSFPSTGPAGHVHDVANRNYSPRLELTGVVMTMYDSRTKLSQQVVSEVRQHFGEKVFETVIPRTTRLAEAPSFGKPIIHYDKYSSGAAAYELLAQELLARLDKPPAAAGLVNTHPADTASPSSSA